MADLYLTPAERYTAALGGFYYGDLPEPGTVYTQLIKDILDGTTPDKEPKNILARFIYSLYISDLGDPYPRYELAKLLYWKLHDITPTKSGSILTVTIDGKEDHMTINTDLSRLWYKVLFGSKTDVITEFPYIFNTMQNKLSDWELFGNVEVSGTPTPDSPIMPQGTGERTGNLFDINATPTKYSQSTTVTVDGRTLTISGAWYIYYEIDVAPNTDYYVDWTIDYTEIQGRGTIAILTTSGQTIKQQDLQPFRFNSSENQRIRLYIYSGNNEPTTIILSNIMLNEGSTALPYEPYGYKLDISSANTTTPVYLGEVETTRKIRKYEFTGQEDISQGSENFYTSLPTPGVPYSNMYCTHNVDGACSVNNNGGYIWFKISSWSDYATAGDLKAFFQQQYTAGTPVTVWYVLATETTGIVNEPLMKIGDYADSLSRAKTGIDIPTVVGQNTLDVLTTVKPSSIRIEYTSADETKSRSKRISLLKSPLKKDTHGYRQRGKDTSRLSRRDPF